MASAILENICDHGYHRGIETGRELSWNEAVTSWYEGVYRPMIETVRRRGVVEAFSGRTETDLYLFAMDHLHQLRLRYGSDEVDPERAVEDFSERGRSSLPARP